jgi:hypothetical protein
MREDWHAARAKERLRGVIPGLRNAQDPESRHTRGAYLWIPGSLLRSAPE